MELQDYHRALGSFPTGVTIVTAFDADHKPSGLTSASSTSVSLNPPITSVCIAKDRWVFPTLSGSDQFAVNILSASRMDFALHFASNVEYRFDDTDWTAGATAPLLPGADAHLDCKIQHRVNAGDHEILLGRVTDHTHAPAPPLVHISGRFFDVPQSEPVL